MSLDKVFKFFQGRHTTFAVAFFISGNLLHWYGRLDGTYISFMATLLGLVLGHAAQENFFNKDKDGGDGAGK